MACADEQKRRPTVLNARVLDADWIEARAADDLLHFAVAGTGIVVATDNGDPSDPDPGRIAATTAGAGFSLAACVDALCENVIDSVSGAVCAA